MCVSRSIASVCANDRSIDRASLVLQARPLTCADINHGRTLPVKDTFLDHVSIGALLVRPHSRGTIKIKSASPFDHAIIDPNCAAALLTLR